MQIILDAVFSLTIFRTMCEEKKKFSKLCLGTVQLGMKYGVNNELGRQPYKEEAFSILRQAIQSGIQYIDTASAYGNAEDLLGEFGVSKYDVNVISKFRFPKYHIQKNVFEIVSDEIETTLIRLNLKCVDGYLLHNAKDFYADGCMAALQKAKERGLVRHVGVSVYDIDDAVHIAKEGKVDYIQIPYNVFDQRIDQTTFFEYTQSNKIVVFARSAFLQGLLLMDLNAVPANLQKVTPYLCEFDAISRQYGFTRFEAAFLFSYCHKGIDKVVFGVDNQAQLEINLNVVRKAKQFMDCYAVLINRFHHVETEIIDPRLWHK